MFSVAFPQVDSRFNKVKNPLCVTIIVAVKATFYRANAFMRYFFALGSIKNNFFYVTLPVKYLSFVNLSFFIHNYNKVNLMKKLFSTVLIMMLFASVSAFAQSQHGNVSDLEQALELYKEDAQIKTILENAIDAQQQLDATKYADESANLEGDALKVYTNLKDRGIRAVAVQKGGQVYSLTPEEFIAAGGHLVTKDENGATVPETVLPNLDTVLENRNDK